MISDVINTFPLHLHLVQTTLMKRIQHVLLAVVLALPGLTAYYVQADEPTTKLSATQPLDIGSWRELFVDGYLVDKLQGADLRLHQPQPQEIVFRFDQPWEGLYSGYVTILKDGDRYRMYYRGMPGAKHDFDTEVTCMAESKDGIRWERPKLGLFEVKGTKENNVIVTRHRICHNFAPFVDTNPDAPADQRYKALGGVGQAGLVAFISADGTHWRPLQKEAVFKYPEFAFDSQNNAFWSETETQYVLYFRVLPKRVRWIARTTSKDFVKWEKPVVLEASGTPMEHLYTNQIVPYPRAPHLYVGMPCRFLPGRRVLSPEEMKAIGTPQQFLNDSTDVILVTTRGGSDFHRWPEAFIRPGRDQQNWTSRANYPVRGIFVVGDELWFYVQHHYGYPTNHLRRYTMRVDGFASVHAGYKGGEMISKPLVFKGNRLTLNFATAAAGSIRVELQTADGKPIPGYTLADCPEIIGDRIDSPVNWKSGADVSKLAGQPVRIRLVLKDADVYSLQFDTAKK